MNIVHICLSMGYTEGLNYQENMLIRYQAAEGHRVSLITTDHCFHEGVWGLCKTEYDYVNPDGVRIIRLPFAFPFPYAINKQIGIFKGFYDRLEELAPEMIFVHNLQFQDLRTVVKYKKEHTEVTVYADNHSDFSNSARTWLSRSALYRFWWKPCVQYAQPHIKAFFGVMPSRVDFLHNIYGIPREKTDILFMGADDEEVKQAVRERFGIRKDDFLIVSGGKIDVFKTQTLLLMEAVRKLDRDRVRLLVFGSVEKELKEPLLALCDGKCVQYIGWAKGGQSYEYFAAADLVVFPGRHSVYWEQAVGQGIPMLCKYWAGTTHVDIGGNVRFLTEDSAELLHKELTYLLDKPEVYAKMREAAGGEARHNFSYRQIARKAMGQDS